MKLTVPPVGVFEGVVVSDTIALHVEEPPTVMGLAQETIVEVLSLGGGITVRLNEPKLPEWSESPIYAPVITWVPSEPGLGV